MNLRLVHSSEPEPLAGDPAPKPGGFAALGRRMLPGSGSAVDDVLVGPSGVYAVVRKPMLGATVPDGGARRHPFLGRLREFAAALERVVVLEVGDLGIPVTPVVCVDGEHASRPAAADGIRTLSRRSFERLLRRAPAVLSERDVTILTQLLRTRLLPA